jgi:cbb3-type cytochrome oxidase subunit 1
MIDQDTQRPICDEPPRFADLRSGKMVEQPHGINWIIVAVCLAAIGFCGAVWFGVLFHAIPAIWRLLNGA